MERIDPTGKPVYSPRNKNKKKIKKNGTMLFSALVEGAESKETFQAESSDFVNYESLEKMLDDIHAIGERVRENISYEAISQYRAAVRAFIKHVVSTALKVEEKHSSPNILRQKKFTIVKIVDQKLERLATGVLSNQQNTLDILGKIDEINGLLIDLIR
ncbi:MAG: YaaR family protein [Spirochaetales bacterium]|nr:YaaR family protein [Spirochaetales bacterium]